MANISRYQIGDLVEFRTAGAHYFGEVFADLGPQYPSAIKDDRVYVRDYSCKSFGHTYTDDAGKLFKGWCISESSLWGHPAHGLMMSGSQRQPDPVQEVAEQFAEQVLAIKPQQHVMGLDPEQIDWERHKAWLGEYR
jgi:hypothetical protein